MSFKKDLTSGVIYTAAAKYLGIIVSIVVTAVLSRLLTPSDFGTIAVSTVFMCFITVITGSGLSPAIIQKSELTKEEISDIFSFTIYLGLACAIIFACLTPLIVHFYNDTILGIICYWLTINVFFSILNIVPNALLFKEKKFKFIAIRTLIVQSVLGVASILGATMGMSIYALLINPIIGSILLFIISYKCYNIRFSYKFNCNIIKDLIPFSSYQIGFNLLNFTYRNLDKLLIGRYFAITTLGYYEKSYRLMMMPLENFSNVINPVLHPLLAEYQHDKSFIFEKYRTITRYFGYVGFLLTSFCYFSSEDIVLALFGSQWTESIIIFKILSLSIGIQIVQSAVGAVFQASGNVKLLFFSGIGSFIITVLAIVAGILNHSIYLLSIYLVISFYIAFFIYHIILLKKVIHASVIQFLRTLARPIISALILGFVLWFWSKETSYNAYFLNLIIKAIISLFVVIILQKIKIIKGIPDILSFIITKIKK